MSLQRFEGPTLEAVLADVRSRLGPDADIVEANRLRRGGLAGFFARERFEVLVHDGPNGGGGAADAGDEEARAALPSTESAGFAAVLDSIVRQADLGDRVDADAGVSVRGNEPGRPAEWGALVRVGLPEELCRPARGLSAGHDPARWIASLLEHAPRPARLPRSRGTVVAAVGERALALELAAQLAADLDLDPAGVVLASAAYRGGAVAGHRRITSLEAAEDQRRSWRRRPHPTVVAVDAGPGRAGRAHGGGRPHDPAGWGRRVLEVLEPAMTWAAVEATRKAEDVVAWTDRLGGVDALAVTGLDETVSPAAILRCHIPVGRLDGRPATPALWGALLAERLAA